MVTLLRAYSSCFFVLLPRRAHGAGCAALTALRMQHTAIERDRTLARRLCDACPERVGGLIVPFACPQGAAPRVKCTSRCDAR